ncbi:MAG: hypothetical protein RBS38_14240 [Bacteroidales bacterium]|jgi:hypothetical protein|nr:hypothetical protein [Bacteroidales bacterium]
MKKYSQFLESLSVLMIFVLLLQLTGCRSTRVISASDLVLLNSEKYSYVIHTPDSKYFLNNASISSDTLYGRITTKESAILGNEVRLYLPADSLLKVNTYSLAAIPLDNIVKSEDVKFSKKKTIVLGAISISVVIAIGIINFISNIGD